MCAVESPNEYRYTSTAEVSGDRWASLIQPVAAELEVTAPEVTVAVAAAGMPSSRAEAASSRAIRRAMSGNFTSQASNVLQALGVEPHGDQGQAAGAPGYGRHGGQVRGLLGPQEREHRGQARRGRGTDFGPAQRNGGTRAGRGVVERHQLDRQLGGQRGQRDQQPGVDLASEQQGASGGHGLGVFVVEQLLTRGEMRG